MTSLFQLIFENETLNLDQLLAGNGRYIGIDLVSGADELLNLPEVKEKLNLGWKPLAKHISIVPPNAIGGLSRLLTRGELAPKDLAKGWRAGVDWLSFAKIISARYGTIFAARAIELGISDSAIAVKVTVPELEQFPPLNAFRHSTLAIPIDGNAVNSNKITNWVSLDNPIVLSGILKML